MLIGYFLKVHLHHFSKIKSPTHITGGIKVFPTILRECAPGLHCCMKEFSFDAFLTPRSGIWDPG
jgi:hypothetical protein